AFDLYKQLAKQDGNLFYSPYSIATALATTYGGARGFTAIEMAHALTFLLRRQDELHPACADLRRRLTADEKGRKFQLVTASRLWAPRGYTFKADFLKLLRDHYDAGLEEVDSAGAPEQARQTMNAWVERQTREKIRNLIPEHTLDKNTRLVLTNASYFK